MSAAVDGRKTSPRKGEVGAKRRVGVENRFDRTPAKTARARRFRRTMTDAERKLWSRLRNNQLGVAFRRQHPLGKYVLDFYCAQLGLVIELDGGQHGESGQADRDQLRSDWLAERGLEVMRFWNNDVLNNLDGVLVSIHGRISEIAAARGIPTPTLPFSRGGSGKEVDR